MTDSDATRPVGGREPWQQAVITDIRRLTSRVVSVTLRPERWRPFLPGQHVDVRLTADDGYQAHRAYSIASAPTGAGTLELVIERLADGEVSPFFHEVAAPGDTLDIRGPFAEHFVWRTDEPGGVFLAAGGSGVAPFLSMVRERAHLPAPPPMALLYSARTWSDVILREELLQHERAQHGFTLAFCLTREPARRPR
ncbi:MAG TPA: FAD-binding oxidoreductase, partial [Gemmatimonadaceae bacterium]|nr:FAD-binding oxidoreductase [Gemmatimonadaceae bacterium]